MLSPNSPAPLEIAAPPGLLEALTEVAESSLFAFCDPCDAKRFPTLAAEHDQQTDPARRGWLWSTVTYSGSAAGSVELGIPRALAEDLCVAFAGDQDSTGVTDAAVHDFAGELVNIICGLWLTRSSRQQLFNLAPPVVRHLDTSTITARARADAGGRLTLATVNDAPVMLAATMAPREA